MVYHGNYRSLYTVPQYRAGKWHMIDMVGYTTTTCVKHGLEIVAEGTKCAVNHRGI